MGWKCHNPQCPAVLPDWARFCRRCGRKRPDPAPINADTGHASALCAGTGFPLESQSPGALYEPPGDNRPPIVLWTILLIVLMIVIGALMVM